jgi:hypothetical protein
MMRGGGDPSLSRHHVFSVLRYDCNLGKLMSSRRREKEERRGRRSLVGVTSYRRGNAFITVTTVLVLMPLFDSSDLMAPSSRRCPMCYSTLHLAYTSSKK